MGCMLDSDWSRKFLLRCDWLGLPVASITTNIHYENLENSTLYQTILKLKNVLCSYTSIVDKIVLKYLQEVHEDY